MRIKSELLVSLGKKNPVKALQLIEELQLRHRNQYNDQIKKLAEALADEGPSLLDVLLAATNSPETKEMIELIKFQRVLEWDPEAAAYLLRDLPESYSKQDKMAAMSRHFLKSDPQKSVEIFSQLLAQSSRGLQRGTNIISEHNYSTHYYKTSPPQMLLEEFIITQPETLINATLPREGDPKGNYRTVAAEWVKHDPAAFAEWISRQEKPKVCRDSAETLSYHLINAHQFPDAMQWSENSRSQGGENTRLIPSVYRNWYARDPEAAGTWRAATTLNPDEQVRLNRIEKKNP